MNKLFLAAVPFLISFCFSATARANPFGAAVQSGRVTISSPGGGLLTINQATPSAIINWQSFSIGQGEITRFNQPRGGAVLNRVVGGNPSDIYGTLQGNGTVYLINPNGVLVGPSGQVNVNGFMASTRDFADSDFLKGGKLNLSGSSTAGVENQGTISAPGGDVFLVGQNVKNSGVIIGRTVGLAAGTQIQLSETGPMERVSVLAGQGSGSGVGVDNAGTIQAVTAELKAAGGNIYALAINNGGAIRATHLVNEGGRIVMRADGGTVVNSGTLDASGTGSGKGGTVEVLGGNVAIEGSSVVNASGGAAGGTVLIGGDTHGSNPAIPNAANTAIAEGAQIRADSSGGNAGKVVVWSDGTTDFEGSISAQAQGATGKGGFAEISGRQNLELGGHAYLAGARGQKGQLLLDPGSVEIQHGADNGAPANEDVFTDGYLIHQLNSGGGNVTISTANSKNGGTEDLTVDGTANNNGPANISWNSKNDLILIGTHSVTLQAGSTIENTGSGGLTLQSPGAINHGGTINLSGDLTLNGRAATVDGSVTVGSLTLKGAGDVGSGSARLQITAATVTDTKSGGTAYLSSTSGVNLDGTMSGGSSLDLVAGGTILLDGALKTTGGNVILSGGVVGGGYTLTANTLTFAGGGDVGSSSARLETAVSTLALNKTSGDIFVHDTGDLNLHGTTAGNLDVIAGGNITVDGGLSAMSASVDANSGNGTVTLSGSGDVMNSITRLETPDSKLVYNKASGITFVHTATPSLTLSGGAGNNGSLNLAADGNVIVSGALSADTASVNANSGTGTVTLNDSGDPSHPGDVMTGSARLNITAATVTDNKSGGTAYLSATSPLNLDGSMSHGSSLDLANTATTTLDAALTTTSGNVFLSGPVGGATYTLTAATLTLSGGGDVGASGTRLQTAVSTLSFNKTGGDCYVNQTGDLNLHGTTAGNLDVTATGNITVDGGLSAMTASVNGGGGTLALSGSGDVMSGSIMLQTADSTLVYNKSSGNAFVHATPTTLTLSGGAGNHGSLNLAADGNVIVSGALSADTASVNANSGTGTVTLNDSDDPSHPGDVMTSSARLNITAATVTDNKSGGTAYLSANSALNLDGTMTGGSSLDLANSLTTTLDGPLSASSSTADVGGNVAISGPLGGGANTLTANTLTLSGGGNVGANGTSLQTAVSTLSLNKTSGECYVNQTGNLNLHGSSKGNLSVTASGNVTVDAGLSAKSASVSATGETLTLSDSFDPSHPGDVMSSTARLQITAAKVTDIKSGGTAYLSSTAALNLDGTMSGGSSLDLVNSATTTLDGALSTSGNVALSGPVAGGPNNTLTANTLTLTGGDVGSSGARVNTSINALDLNHAGSVFLNQTFATTTSSLNLQGQAAQLNISTPPATSASSHTIITQPGLTGSTPDATNPKYGLEVTGDLTVDNSSGSIFLINQNNYFGNISDTHGAKGTLIYNLKDGTYQLNGTGYNPNSFVAKILTASAPSRPAGGYAIAPVAVSSLDPERIVTPPGILIRSGFVPPDAGILTRSGDVR